MKKILSNTQPKLNKHPLPQNFMVNQPMGNVRSLQMQIGQPDIADIVIDVTSHDDIPMILLGLQHIYTTQSLRKAVFKILEEVIPSKEVSDVAVDANKARPGMDQWSFLVLGTLRLGLNADYDRIQKLANHHRTLRMMLGHGLLPPDKDYRLQILKDNLKLFTPELMARINVEVIHAGYQLLDSAGYTLQLLNLPDKASQ